MPTQHPRKGLGFSSGLLIVEFWATLTVSVLLFCLMMQAFYLPKTPVAMTSGIIIALGVWLATRSFEGLARTAQFWFPLIMLSVCFVTVTVLFHAQWPSAALPSPLIALKPIGEGALTCWYLWISGRTYQYLAQFLRTPSRAPNLVTFALLIQGSVVMIFYLLTLTNVGPYATALLQWPVVYVVQTIEFHAFIISSLGMVLVMSWTVALILHLAVHLWCLGTLLRDQTHAGDRMQVGAIIGFGVFMIAAIILLPWTKWPLSNILVDWIGPLDLVRLAFIALPAAVLHRWFRQRHKKKEAVG